MILTRDGKEIVAIYKQNGDEVDEVKDANGRLVYTNTREITGTPPLSFTSRGKPLTDYRISGNTVQDGTPTPDAPVDVVGCGVRTANLFDKDRTNGVIDNSYINAANAISSNSNYYISYPIYLTVGETYTWRFDNSQGHSNPTVGFYDSSNNLMAVALHDANATDFSFTVPSGCAYVRCSVFKILQSEAMLNLGSTVLPYEPYGYKLPLTVNGAEYPIYLGEAQTTRRIKKLVLTGEENWAAHTAIASWYYVDNIFSPIVNTGAYCDRYKFASYSSAEELTNGQFTFGNPGGITSIRRLIFKDTAQATVTDFKTYLQQQYSAGHPVTIWYILANPETGIVNEPLMKIGDYADIITMAQAGVTIPTTLGTNVLDMLSPVKPSEVYVKGKGIRAIT